MESEADNQDSSSPDLSKTKIKGSSIPIPLQLDTYRNYYPVINTVQATNTGFRSKPGSQYLNNTVSTIHNEINASSVLLTVTIPSSQFTPRQAWDIISHLEQRLVGIFREQFSDVIYLLSGIEMHINNKLHRVPEVNKHNRYVFAIPDTLTSRKHYTQELLRVFQIHNSDLSFCPTNSMEEAVTRILHYAASINNTTPLDSTDPTDLDAISIDTYNNLLERGGGKALLPPTVLDGYPHIHLAVVRTVTDSGELRPIDEYYHPISTLFHDIDIRRKKGKGRRADHSNDSRIIQYVLKNSQHNATRMLLDRFPVTLFPLQPLSEIHRLFDGLLTKASITINGVIPPGKVSSNRISTASLPRRTTIIVRLPSNRDQKAISYISAYMIKNELRLTTTEPVSVYKKIPNSRNSWAYYCTRDDLWHYCTNYDNVEAMLKFNNSFMKTTSNPKQELYPALTLDFRWLEYNDFFLFLSTGTLTTIDTYFSHSYNPAISLSDLGLTIDDHGHYTSTCPKPRQWCYIIENSNYIVDNQLTSKGDDLLDSLYRLYLPSGHKSNGHKSKVPVLYGEPNSCKSSLIAPITSHYPLEKIATIEKNGGFELSNLVNKEIAILDEFDDTASGLSRGSLLKMFEGQNYVNINKKHRDPYTDIITARLVTLCNKLEWTYDYNQSQPLTAIFANDIDERRIDPAFKARLEFYPFRSMPTHRIRSGGKEQMVREERGAITLYLAMHHFRQLQLINDIDELQTIISTNANTSNQS